jgi:hypothetical protein
MWRAGRWKNLRLFKGGEGVRTQGLNRNYKFQLKHHGRQQEETAAKSAEYRIE